MKIALSVVAFLRLAIADHRKKFAGKDPVSIWIAQASMNDLCAELQPMLKFKEDQPIYTVKLFDIPINVTTADAPYLLNAKRVYELL